MYSRTRLDFRNTVRIWGRRVIGIPGYLILSKTLIFNSCGELRWCPESPVSQIHSPYLHAGDPGIFQILKREWGAESNGKLPHLFIHNNTAILVSEFVVKDLPFSRIAILVTAFAVKGPLGENTLIMMTDDVRINSNIVSYIYYNSSMHS